MAENYPSSSSQEHLDSHVCALTLSTQDHIYKLMKSDSYTRFLRSNVYQDLLMAKKKVCVFVDHHPIQPLLCTNYVQ